MKPDISNGLLLQVFLEELAARSMTIEDYEIANGLELGHMAKVLEPKEERTINRNIKIIAMHLGIPAGDFFEKLWGMAEVGPGGPLDQNRGENCHSPER